MPITLSAKKALKQSIRRHKRNSAKQKAVKTAVKKYQRLLAVGNLEAAKKYLPTLYKAVDKAAKTNVIKKGKADRLKSRLSKKLSITKH